jgi:putative DNA primase/helicase
VPFTVIIPEHEQDKDLPEKMREEWPGVLNWAIEGCLLWQREGLGFPEAVKQATLEYRTEEDVFSLFLDEHTEEDRFAITGAKEIYGTYTKWCDETGEKPLTQTAFGRLLVEKGFSKERGAGGRKQYIGIRVI